MIQQLYSKPLIHKADLPLESIKFRLSTTMLYDFHHQDLNGYLIIPLSERRAYFSTIEYSVFCNP